MTPLQQQLIRIGSFAGPSWASYPLEEARGSDERLRLLREGEWVLYQDGTELCPVYLNRCRIGTIAQMLRYRRRVLRWYGARDLLAKESEQELNQCSPSSGRVRTENNTPAVAGKGCL